jgi:hypothetical protein
LKTIDEMITFADTCELPSNAENAARIAAIMATMVTPENFPAIALYLNRMFDAGYKEATVIFMRDAVKRDGALCFTDTFIRIAQGPIGKFVATADLTGILY